ncbi:MAG: sulfotransferase family protein [Acidimicrobiales bacterium]
MSDQILRRLPNFLYIGPDKAGSSWLHEVLVLHPQIYMTEAKDLYFFDRYYDRGIAWYARQFEGAGPHHRIVGELTQDYLFCTEAPARIRHDLGPEIQMMVTLRDPVARAFSSYLYMLKQGEQPGTFHEALTRRPELIEHGRYAGALRRFYDHFPPDQILITVFDDLQADNQAFADRVFAFLGVDSMALDESLRAPRLRAARARSVAAARLARAAANWVRLRDGAGFVGRVKRSPFVQKLLYRELQDDMPRLDEGDAAVVRDLLAEDVADLDRLVGRGLRQRWAWPTDVPTATRSEP